jgi:hypothetical protein
MPRLFSAIRAPKSVRLAPDCRDYPDDDPQPASQQREHQVQQMIWRLPFCQDHPVILRAVSPQLRYPHRRPRLICRPTAASHS